MRSGSRRDVKLDVDQFARGIARVHVYLNDARLRPGESSGEKRQEQRTSGHISNGSNRREAHLS